MNIPKAIENLKAHTPKAPPYFDPDLVTAMKLGSEALRRLIDLRDDPKLNPKWILPSETKD